MTATAIAPPPFSLASTPSVQEQSIDELTLESQIDTAKQMWEEGNKILLKAGEIFSGVKDKVFKKRKFSKVLEPEGLKEAEVSKLIKAYKVKDAIAAGVAPTLSVHMLIQLGQPNKQAARDAIASSDSMLDVDRKMKEHCPSPKKGSRDASNPCSIVRREQGGGKRYAQLNKIHDQNLIAELNRIFVEDGVTQTQFLEDSVCSYKSKKINQTTPTDNTKPPIELDTSIENQAIASETSASQEIITTPLLSSTADNEQVKVQAEIYSYLEEQVKEIAPEVSEEHTSDSTPSPTLSVAEAELTTEEEAIASTTASDICASPDVPKEKTDESQLETPANAQAIAPGESIAQPDTPSVTPTERYKQGWNPGDEAIANTTNNHFVEWCENQPVIIKKVSGDVGTIQMVTVVRHDGKTRRVGGNWLEDVPPPSSDFKVALYRVVGVDNEWEGKVVKIDSPGEYNHLVSCPQDGAWTHIAPKCLVPLDSTEVTEYAQAEIIHLAQLVKQSSQEIATADDFLKAEPRYGIERADAEAKIGYFTNRRCH